ncbi:LytTR family DNA-binding domain-containing protein [Cellulophaga baltica]|uniref:LytR/AlgR family response regulator transcription factor n=1 Tax=Cellulophaga TaxID=104264 RepID=UPI001C07ADA9|nr:MULTISPECIES: LytTR family DNA-binding domain-containing protein [Cellulophaga]MBU2996252.1 LytTR family DNA-binding domain-containing protein [Cellulophaga baltica]MDO6767647.1 LytTR family DNA-binding domain-containing protein [Cellulophaga sp. 1_MG-2023]
MKKLKCLVIDDEELARALIKSYINDVDFLELEGDFENPLEALQVLKTKKIDLLFLDIQMPEIKGTEFAKIVGGDTKIIFTTAYSEYALEGYELNVVDYLLKPITFTRFLTAVQKVNVETNALPNDTDESITIKSGYDLHKVKYSDINYIKSDSEYVTFYTDGKKIMSLQSLKSLEKTIPSELFIRVHRSYIVNKSKVNSLTGRDLVLNDTKIPISDSYYDKVKAELF